MFSSLPLTAAFHTSVNQTRHQCFHVFPDYDVASKLLSLVKWPSTATSSLTAAAYAHRVQSGQRSSAVWSEVISTTGLQSNISHQKIDLVRCIWLNFGHQLQPFYGPLSRTTRVSQYQKKHSPTHTYPDHQPSSQLPPSTTIHSILPV